MIRAILLAEAAGPARSWLLAHGIEDLVVPERAEIALLGTGGAALAHASLDPERTLLVLRDVAPEAFDLSALVRQHSLGESALTVALFPRTKAEALGWSGPAAEMDRSGRILRWSPKGDHDRDLDWIDAGACVIAPACRKRLPPNAPWDLARQLVPTALRNQLFVRGWRAGAALHSIAPFAQTSKPTT